MTVDEKATVQWFETASKLAKAWSKSMSHKSFVKVSEEDVRDFLVDLWFAKNGQGPEFEEQNRGMLNAYAVKHLTHSRDVLRKAESLSDVRSAGWGDDDEMDEDRLECLSYSDDEEAVDDQEQDEALGDLLGELSEIRDSSLSSALSEVLGISDRRARAFASEARSEKILALVVKAAKQRGMKPAAVKKLAAEIAAECRRSINADGEDASQDEIEVFERMMGLSKPHAPAPTTAIQAKIRSRREKQQPKSALPLPVPQQQSIQLELV